MAEFTNIKINDVQYDVKDANAARASALATKQDVISDLSAIRSGAALGATALQSYTETDPTVPAWAKSATKPSYTASEISGLSAVATSGSYNDLTDKPTIPAAITVDSTITQNGTNPVQGGAIYSALQEKAGTVYYSDIDEMNADETQNSGTLAFVDDGSGFHIWSLPDMTWYKVVISDDLDSYVPTARKINNKSLSSDITLNASDVGALPNNTHIPADQVQSNWNETNTSSKAYIQNKPTIPDTSTLATKTELNAKANSADVANTYATKSELGGKLSQSDVSVETQGDGTVDLKVKDDTYTINLNHTHENMAKLVVCEESDLPSTLANDTIYAIKGLGNTSIEKLIIQGLVFAGGGGGGSSEQSYDAEIEYLQSTGTQYIDTGIVASTDFACEIKAEFTANGNSWDTLLGSYSGATAYGVALALRYGNDANKCYIQFGGDGGASRAISSVNTLGLHTYKTSASNSTVKIDVDGSVNTNPYDNAQPSTLSMYLFARHRADTSIGNYAKAKVYYCKIWNGGNLVFDAIPVRVGQVGYMYDKVSGQLFGNNGTGSFTLGNDKS